MSDLKIKVSHSQIQSFNRCHFAWHLSYEKGLTLVEVKPHLDFGSYVHELLAAYYTAHQLKKSPEDCWGAVADVGTARVQAAGHNSDDLQVASRGLRLVSRYISEFAPAYDRGWITLGVEYHFLLPFTSPGGVEYELEGYIDWITQSPEGKIWITDHKTVTNKFWNDTEVVMDPQLPIYSAGLRGLGKNVFGYQVNMLNGYEYKDPASVNKDKLFKRTSTYKTPTELDQVVEEIGCAVDDMVRMQETNVRRRMLKRDCSYCDHQELCMIDMKGIDTTPVIEARYKIKEPFVRKGLTVNAPL